MKEQEYDDEYSLMEGGEYLEAYIQIAKLKLEITYLSVFR